MTMDSVPATPEPVRPAEELPDTTGREPSDPTSPSGSTARVALVAAAASLGIGWLGDQLIFWSGGFGLNGFLWVLTLVTTAFALGRWGGLPLTGEGRWLMAAAVFFAGGLMWRSSSLLQGLDLLAIAFCLGLAAVTARGGSLSRSGVISYLAGLLLSSVNHLIGPFALLFHDIRWQELPRSRWSERMAAILRGLIIALPLLFLFGSLFVAADAVFERMIQNLFTLNLPRLADHVFGLGFFGFLAAGFLRTALLQKPGELPQVDRPPTFALGAIETGLVLGLLNLLFLSFVLVQIRYLFGGAALVQQTVHLTYAEYARRGFFELVSVAALVLPVLLVLHWLIPPDRKEVQRLFRWLGGSLIALLYVIMASAVQRMLLYQQEYGLTELRLFTTAFMAWLAFVFAWFLFTVLRGRHERFAVGALASGLFVLAALHGLNPSDLIVRKNVALLQTTGRFDGAYAASLGPDAIPALVEALPALPPAEQEVVAAELQFWSERLQRKDWRSWNWGRARALNALQSLKES
ncbi:MAG TPA: DUF4173 domain-containing protein [Symbiobacteriaceae bacterium]